VRKINPFDALERAKSELKANIRAVCSLYAARNGQGELPLEENAAFISQTQVKKEVIYALCAVLGIDPQKARKYLAAEEYFAGGGDFQPDSAARTETELHTAMKRDRRDFERILDELEEDD
jgi:hypothetical protein